MTEEHVRRKLRGILSADAVGYSRLMQDDEVATIRTLEDCKSLIRELIQQFQGRVVDAPGDNLLAEFDSVIDAQLIDGTTGGHLWAERYDGTMENIFALQDKITHKIVAALKVTLTTGDKKHATSRETDDPAAYDAFLKGWAHYRRKTPEDLIKAIPYLDEAVERDPNYSRAYAALAAVYWNGARSFWGKYLDMSKGEAEMTAHIYLAEAMQNPTPLAHWIASDMHRSSRRHQKAITEATRAIALDANDPIGYYVQCPTH